MESRGLKMTVRKTDACRRFKKFHLPSSENARADEVYSETMKRAVRDMLDEGFELKRLRSVILPENPVPRQWFEVALAVSTILGVYVTKDGKIVIRSERFSPTSGAQITEIWSLVPSNEEKEAEA